MMRGILWMLCAASFAVSASAQAPPKFDATTSVDIVSVPVTVTTSAGRFAFGLTRDDFEVREDGARRPLTQFSAERVPVSLGILLDISGSMAQDPKAKAVDDARWADTRRALERLIARLDRRDDVLFAAFSEGVGLAVPWTPDHGRVLTAFDRLQPGGPTGLFNAIKLISPAFRLAQYHRKVLLLVSDGWDTSIAVGPKLVPGGDSTYMGVSVGDPAAGAMERQKLQHQMKTNLALNESIAALREPGALLYAIGMATRKGATVNLGVLKQLTEASGGYVEPLGNPSEISDAVARIADDLQAQYFLAFEPTHRDGRVHTISVTTRNKNLKVRARSAYTAATK